MKGFIITLIILGAIAFSYFNFVHPLFFNEIGEDEWHVVILNEYLNVRTDHDVNATQIDTVRKGGKYRAVEVEPNDEKYVWYKIELPTGEEGWIANTKDSVYLEDHNNPNDIVVPVIKYEEPELLVSSINDIDYDHLEIIDNSDDYTITHKVRFEQAKNQYWIVYHVEDKGGNVAEKTQRIIFDTVPTLSEVEAF